MYKCSINLFAVMFYYTNYYGHTNRVIVFRIRVTEINFFILNIRQILLQDQSFLCFVVVCQFL